MASTGAVVVTGIWILVAGTAPSRSDAATAAEAMSSLRVGQIVRVAAGGQTVMEGRFVAVRDGRLVLDHPANSLPLEAVETVWVRERRAAQGATTGGILGGLAIGVYFGMAGVAMCERDTCDSEFVKFGAVGALLGGLGGGATGAAIGSAFVHWRRLDFEKADAATPNPRPASPLAQATPVAAPALLDIIDSLSLHVGGDKALDSRAPSGGVGGRLCLSAHLNDRVAPSLEIGRYRDSLLHFGPAVTVDLARGRVRPYALASVGRYTWNARSFIGGSLGGGVRLHGKSPFSFGAEGRWHSNVTNVPEVPSGEAGRRLSALTLTAGATVTW